MLIESRLPAASGNPRATQDSIFARASDYRAEERSELSDDALEFGSRYVWTIFRAKSVPLFDPAPIFVELWGEGERHAVFRQIGSAMFKGDANGFGEDFPVKFKGGRQAVQIVEILHTTIGNAQFHDRFELLRDNGFARIDK